MYKKCIKRILDIIFSVMALIVLSPIYVIIGILIKFIDNGNIIFSQYRTGINGNNFKIYKFKTLKDNKVTKLGKILRKTSLDELPQFYNVLKGDMSIVGPRPWIPEYYENFNNVQKRRVEVKPGIIGLAQVNGRRKISVFEKINFDIEYVENISFIMDLKILFNTLKVLIIRDDSTNNNAYIEEEIELLKKQNKKV